VVQCHNATSKARKTAQVRQNIVQTVQHHHRSKCLAVLGVRIMIVSKPCKLCQNDFEYCVNLDDLRGIQTKKYCESCIDFKAEYRF